MQVKSDFCVLISGGDTGVDCSLGTRDLSVTGFVFLSAAETLVEGLPVLGTLTALTHLSLAAVAHQRPPGEPFTRVS